MHVAVPTIIKKIICYTNDRSKCHDLENVLESLTLTSGSTSTKTGWTEFLAIMFVNKFERDSVSVKDRLLPYFIETLTEFNLFFLIVSQTDCIITVCLIT